MVQIQCPRQMPLGSLAMLVRHSTRRKIHTGRLPGFNAWSIPKLSQALSEMNPKLEALDQLVRQLEPQVRDLASRRERAQREVPIIEEEIKKLWADPHNKRLAARFFSAWVSGTGLIPTAEATLITLRQTKERLTAESRNLGLEAKFARATEEQRQLRARRDACQSALVRKTRERERMAHLRAEAAKNLREVRDLGASIRRRLESQKDCPYCDRPLPLDKAKVHADHIYPVSKGGRSVIRNMVLVCAACNAEKEDLTLRAFLEATGRNRLAVEARLKLLGKDF